MNYSVGCAFSVKDLFINFPYDKLKFNCNDALEANGNLHRDLLVKKIFLDSVKLVIDDIIDNNVTFKLPLVGVRAADIHMLQIRDEKFKNLKKSGKWENLDFITSDFTGYLLGLFMYGKRTPRVKNIYVSANLRDKIIDYANKGKTYC